MKRYLLVTAAILLVMLGAWAVQIHMHHQLQDFKEAFFALSQLVGSGDMAAAKDHCQQIVDAWDEKREYWEIFIDHTALDETESTIYALKGYIAADAPRYQIMAVFSQLEAELVQIDMQTRLSIGHLL